MKNKVLGYSAPGIAFVVLSVILFVIPIERTTAFWIAYGFTVVAFGLQIVLWQAALGRENTMKSKFLGFPLVHIGIAYLILQVVALIVFAAIPELPTWSAIVTCVLLLGASSICLIASEAGRTEIDRVEKAVQKKVFYIRSLQSDLEMIAETESNQEIKQMLIQLAEKVRFSDPMSADELEDIENRIISKVNELKNCSDRQSVIKELDLLLIERNKKCKFLK